MNELAYKPTRGPASAPVVVLASPVARDRQYLREQLERSRIRTVEVSTCREALSAAGMHGARVVVCDESLGWKDLLSYLASECEPPRLIVIAATPCTSFVADVLSLGGLDVLPTPFFDEDIARILLSACMKTAVLDPSVGSADRAGKDRRQPLQRGQAT